MGKASSIVFDLAGHPTATMAYAWSSPIKGGDKRRFYAVLHVLPITSAGGCCAGGYRGGATLEEELMHQKILKELREIKGMDWLFVLAAFIAGILLGMSWQFLHSN